MTGPDAQSLPSRRALRAAERARSAEFEGLDVSSDLPAPQPATRRERRAALRSDAPAWAAPAPSFGDPGLPGLDLADGYHDQAGEPVWGVETPAPTPAPVPALAPAGGFETRFESYEPGPLREHADRHAPPLVADAPSWPDDWTPGHAEQPAGRGFTDLDPRGAGLDPLGAPDTFDGYGEAPYDPFAGEEPVGEPYAPDERYDEPVLPHQTRPGPPAAATGSRYAEPMAFGGPVPHAEPSPFGEPVPAGHAYAEDVPETFRAAPDPSDTGMVPRPSPVRGSQSGDPDLAPAVPVASSHNRLLRQLPQLGVVGAMVAATAGYAVLGDLGGPNNGAEEPPPEFLRAGTEVDEDTTEAGLDVAAGLDAEERLEPDDDGIIRLRDDDQASRDGLRTPVAGCDGAPPEFTQQNGEMDGTYLCDLPWAPGESLRADAAIALSQLNEAFRAHFGRDICITDSYRSYSAQVSLRQRKPHLAARPGTSNHGYGLAVDLCGGVESRGSAYWWLMENGRSYGFENPRWAQSGGGGPFEPWHWEYFKGM